MTADIVDTDSSPAPDPLREFGFLLRDLARLSSLNFERHAQRTGAAAGMTLAQCRVLSYLQRNEGISKVRLAELTGTDPMTLGRLLQRMTDEGLVDQQVDPQDRRAHRLYLKGDKARQVLDEIWQIADHSRAEALAGFSDEERSHLVSQLRRIQANLDALMPGEADRASAPLTSTPRRLSPC